MGIIVADELDLMGNGVIVPNCYVNIDRIVITKSNIRKIKVYASTGFIETFRRKNNAWVSY